jgi:CRISPR-associated protein Csb2
MPTRLLVWRDGSPFDADEQTAVLRAAARELSWAAAGSDANDWKIRLVPLDEVVPPPPGFDGALAKTWESLTPYVPPRHYLRGAKPRPSESIAVQIRRELALRGTPGGQQTNITEISDATWVAVHLPRRAAVARTFIGDRRGYWLRLEFLESVPGPIRLGHSSSFGLGLFRPVS